MGFRRGWWKASNGLIALGVVLLVSGVQGAAASADRLHVHLSAAGLAVALDRVGAGQESAVFLPPTLRPTPTATPFDDMRPLPGAIPAMDQIAPRLPTPTPTPALDPAGYPPERIVIPSIQLDAPVVVSRAALVTVQGQQLLKWSPPDRFAVGWQETSAPLGLVGNTVFNGHNNIHGDVFARLEDVRVGDAIHVYSGEVSFEYRVTNRMILPELYQELAVRLANAQWIEPSQDERLTLVTCWPLNGNSHRLILVARPVGNSVQDVR